MSHSVLVVGCKQIEVNGENGLKQRLPTFLNSRASSIARGYLRATSYINTSETLRLMF